MTTAQDVIDAIKSDLVISGSDYDAQLLRAVQSALRELRGKRYWFLEKYTTLSTTIGSETVSLPSDFSAPKSFEIISDRRRYKDKDGFDFYGDIEELRAQYWLTEPLETRRPEACAVFAGSLYLSALADAIYTLPVWYYKKDASPPGLSDSSVWFDDGLDVARSKAMYIFKRDAQGMTLNEADGDMVAGALEDLNNTHIAMKAGG